MIKLLFTTCLIIWYSDTVEFAWRYITSPFANNVVKDVEVPTILLDAVEYDSVPPWVFDNKVDRAKLNAWLV